MHNVAIVLLIIGQREKRKGEERRIEYTILPGDGVMVTVGLYPNVFGASSIQLSDHSRQEENRKD